MSSPFPLLRLPRLVLFDVFKSLSIGEKIKLSICSKKIYTQFNNARLYSQKVIVALDMHYQNIKVYSEDYKDRFEISIRFIIGMSNDPDVQQYQIEGRTVLVTFYLERITTFWKDYQEGFLSVIPYLLMIFRGKIQTNTYYHSYQSIISELLDLQLEFRKLVIEFKGLKHQNLRFNQIFNKLELVEFLSISSIPGPGFRPVFTSWPQKIIIRSSDWFTLKSLLTCTCNTITLTGSHLGNEDLDEIIKKWKAGGFPNLERLEIDKLRFTNNGEHILGVNWRRELDRKVIQTEDGSKKATIRISDRSIEMSITPFE
ncbi:hypothetical protein CRE_22057 [Caenorhabditis remanei]|uniref:F-box domain-containing protein n=1 Tax=Caenorhabditis remanei TaxID=31234 RepID=E3N3L0_CAERE|nr:hypothetical protein CRE_22057 [Caenorhabditis remanei]